MSPHDSTPDPSQRRVITISNDPARSAPNPSGSDNRGCLGALAELLFFFIGIPILIGIVLAIVSPGSNTYVNYDRLLAGKNAQIESKLTALKSCEDDQPCMGAPSLPPARYAAIRFEDHKSTEALLIADTALQIIVVRAKSEIPSAHLRLAQDYRASKAPLRPQQDAIYIVSGRDVKVDFGFLSGDDALDAKTYLQEHSEVKEIWTAFGSQNRGPPLSPIVDTYMAAHVTAHEYRVFRNWYDVKRHPISSRKSRTSANPLNRSLLEIIEHRNAWWQAHDTDEHDETTQTALNPLSIPNVIVYVVGTVSTIREPWMVERAVLKHQVFDVDLGPGEAVLQQFAVSMTQAAHKKDAEIRTLNENRREYQSLQNSKTTAEMTRKAEEFRRRSEPKIR